MRLQRVVITLAALALAASFVPAATACNLSITINCQQNGSNAQCTSTTVNNGAACTGAFYAGFEAPGSTTAVMTNFSSGLTGAECFTSADFPAGAGINFPVGICFGEASLAPGASLTGSVTISGAATSSILAFTGVSEGDTDEPTFVYAFANATTATCTPTVSAPPISQSGVAYNVAWSATSDPSTSFVVEEATSADFANATSKTVTGTSTTFTHQVTATTTYYYRVHATTCGGAPGPLSGVVTTVVQAPPPPNSRQFDNVVPIGSTTPVSFQLFIPAPSAKTALDSGFTASTDKSYLTVTPSSGTIPPGGTTVTVTATPVGLPPGANTGTVSVTPTNGTPTNTPVSISLVTPVSPGGKSMPPSNALIIPVVTHVVSGAGPFQSDVRLTNASSAAINYQLTYIPTATDGTQTARVTMISVTAGQTVALNDVAKDFFGVGAAPGDAGAGSLEIRPINTSSTRSYASSRTFVTGATGTYGQFVAAVPFSQFAGTISSSFFGAPPSNGPAVISLQQVAESAKFRTNLGIVEGSGSPASGRIRVFNDAGTLLKEVPYSLRPGEHQQMNQFIKNTAGIANLDDGRIEITVDSPTGAISAYASVLDNKTADPLAVMPVQVSTVSSTRYIVPGMAELVSPVSNFHSDMRIFNGGTSAANVTMTYFPLGGGTGVPAATFALAPGQVKAFDNVLPAAFGLNAGGGSVVITTPANSSLVATGRTYSSDASGGTFGQFIPGVTPQQGIAAGDAPLQILQLEESSRFRTNIGITELSGLGADVTLTIIPPEGRTSAQVTKHLDPNEYYQFNKIIASAYPDAQMYNVRVAVQVTGGSGRVAAYASVIDNSSLDPTYVPAQ